MKWWRAEDRKSRLEGQGSWVQNLGMDNWMPVIYRINQWARSLPSQNWQLLSLSNAFKMFYHFMDIWRETILQRWRWRDHPPSDSILKHRQRLVLDKPETRSQNLHLGHSQGWQGSNCLNYCLLGWLISRRLASQAPLCWPCCC